MNIFSKLHGDSQGAGRDNRNLVTSNAFLSKEGNVNYFTAEGFLLYVKSLRKEEVEQLEQFFEFVKKGYRMTGNFITRQDRADRPYLFPSFHQVNATPAMKIITEGGMKAFINDYREGKISTNFTLDELVEEALN